MLNVGGGGYGGGGGGYGGGGYGNDSMIEDTIEQFRTSLSASVKKEI